MSVQPASDKRSRSRASSASSSRDTSPVRSSSCRYVLHLYSGEKEPIHPLSEFCRRAVPLTDMLDDIEVVLVDSEEVLLIDALVAAAGVPCLLLLKDDSVAKPLIGVALRLWFDSHVASNKQQEYDALCQQFARAEAKMIERTRCDLSQLDTACTRK